MGDSRPVPGLTSIVVPVYNEGDNIETLLRAPRAEVQGEHETLIVYDFEEDTTLPPARAFSAEYGALRLELNTTGPGALNALKHGLAAAQGDAVVVTMADLSDDVSQIDEIAALVRAGTAVVSPSRYMAGGRQIGGPPVKRLLSRTAGLSLHFLTGIGTKDPTNNYKGYAASFLAGTEIESNRGFELGLELATKAHLAGLHIDELPTTWTDRVAGESRFKVLAWMPAYLRWYGTCIAGTWSGLRRRNRRRLEAVV